MSLGCQFGPHQLAVREANGPPSRRECLNLAKASPVAGLSVGRCLLRQAAVPPPAVVAHLDAYGTSCDDPRKNPQGAPDGSSTMADGIGDQLGDDQGGSVCQFEVAPVRQPVHGLTPGLTWRFRAGKNPCAGRCNGVGRAGAEGGHLRLTVGECGLAEVELSASTRDVGRPHGGIRGPSHRSCPRRPLDNDIPRMLGNVDVLGIGVRMSRVRDRCVIGRCPGALPLLECHRP